MFVSNCLSVNAAGHLTIGGADVTVLAKEFGTPLYVMDEATIRESCRQFKASIDEYYDGNGLCVYASKSFCCKEICRIVAEEGLGLDVVSGGELYTAHEAGFPMERVYFHGNNKTEQELEMALAYGVGAIVVDNRTELERLGALAAKAGKPARILFRVKPGVDAHTHNYIRTGQIDSKFGLALETGEAYEAVRAAMDMDSVDLVGLHCHIGSQIFELDPFADAARIMLDFIAKIRDELGADIRELNLGGGFGIRYTQDEHPRAYAEFMQRVSGAVHETCARHGMDMPRILIEPGRSISGPAGITLYTVGAVKEIPGVRTYVSVDGGMTDNPRYALYEAPYEAVVANRAGEPRDFVATIAGRCCESGDLIQEHTHIQRPEPGDLLAVFATGAYNYSMSSNYNRIPRPAVVMITNGKPRIIVRAETYADLLRNDL